MSGEIDVIIKQFAWNVVDSNSWLMIEGNSGLMIDAVDGQELYDEISTLDDLTVVITHAHFDHIIGLNKIRELEPTITVIATEKCSTYLGNIYRNMSSTATAYMKFYVNGSRSEVEIPPFICDKADKTFEKKIEFNWCKHKINLEAFHGHSNDSLITVVDNKYMFSGDTLLPIPTVTRFPSGSTRRFWEEDIPMLRKMENIEMVYPGHGMPGKLKDMLNVNVIPEKYRKITMAFAFEDNDS